MFVFAATAMPVRVTHKADVVAKTEVLQNIITEAVAHKCFSWFFLICFVYR